jgi:hypothetical protein
MKSHLAALMLGTTLFATAALADNMSTHSMSNSPMATHAMAPASSGMMAAHKPKPKKHTAMGAVNTMAPAMAPSNGGASH